MKYRKIEVKMGENITLSGEIDEQSFLKILDVLLNAQVKQNDR